MTMKELESLFCDFVKEKKHMVPSYLNDLQRKKAISVRSSVADPGCLSRILDPNFFITEFKYRI